MMLLKIAWLNMRAHGTRSLVIVIAVAITVLFMQVLSSILGGVEEQFVRNIINQDGHVALFAPGSEDALNPLDLSYLIQNPDEVQAFINQQPETQVSERILGFGAMLLVGERNLPVQGYGIVPDPAFFTPVQEGMQEGVQETPGDSRPGAGLPQQGQILLSTRIDELLDVGDEDPVLLVEDSAGSPYYLSYEVSGLYDTDSVTRDQSTIFITHEDAEELLYVPDSTRVIRVLIDEPREAGAFADRLRAEFPELRVETWRSLNAQNLVLFEFMDVFSFFINLFMVIVAASVIINAVFMNVFEKVNEYGTMRAIGLKRRGQWFLILSEGAAEGLVGSLAGTLLSVPLAWLLTTRGISIGEVGDAFSLGATMYGSMGPGYFFINLALGTLIAVAASAYAALVMGRKSIPDALGEV